MNNLGKKNDMREIMYFVLFVFFIIPLTKLEAQNKDFDYYLTGLPFKMPKIELPVFPEKTFNILDYGANGNGQVLNTDMFKKTIDACSKAGGGTVLVPPGVWLTGPIQLESNINLHLEKGALILLSRNHEEFPIIKYPGSSKYSAASPVYGFNLENIAITGEGIIDGSGDTWRPVKKSKTTVSQWRGLLASGGVVSSDGQMWWPSKEAMDGEAYLKKMESENKKLTPEDYLHVRDFLRPYMILLINCKNVLLDGPTFENSPKFVFYPNRCENVVIRNIKVLNEWYAQNGDGIDISACKNVLIYNCTLSVGDDGICMKSSKSSRDGNEAALQNIVIADCVVYHAHGGFVIGSNTDGGMKNISVKNCNFIGTDIGLRFKSVRGKGGLVEDIYVDNIFMKDIVNQAILFDTYYEVSQKEGEEQKVEVNDKTPRFQKFYISNVVCNGAKNAVTITGLPEMPIKDINLKNITISAKTGFASKEAENINLANVKIYPSKGAVYTLENSKNFTFDNVLCPQGTNVFMKLDGKETGNIQIKNSDLVPAKTPIEYGKDVKQDAVIKN